MLAVRAEIAWAMPRVRGMALIELLIAVGLFVALTSLALSPGVERAISTAKHSTQQRNLGRIESALELFHGRHGRYPASLDDLTGPPEEIVGSQQAAGTPYLASLPPNPLGKWGYDGRGRVWPIERAPVSSPAGVPSPIVTAATPLHLAALLALALSFLGSLAANLAPAVLAAAWQALLGASAQTLAFRGRAWDHLVRSAWLGLAKDLIHNEGDLTSLVRYSSRVPLTLGPALHGLTARLHAHMRRQAVDYSIPIRRSQWKTALANFQRFLPSAASGSAAPRGPSRGLARSGWLDWCGALLALAGSLLALLACRAASRPLLTDFVSLALLATAVLLDANLLLSSPPAPRPRRRDRRFPPAHRRTHHP